MLVSIGKVARLIGVSISTLRRWESEDYLQPETRTKGGHRRYKLAYIKEFFLGEQKEQKINVAYARVSSSDQKADLVRQAELLEETLSHHRTPYKVIKDLGSGLKTDKPGLRKLLSLILSGNVEKLVRLRGANPKRLGLV